MLLYWEKSNPTFLVAFRVDPTHGAQSENCEIPLLRDRLTLCGLRTALLVDEPLDVVDEDGKWNACLAKILDDAPEQ